jgi:hypothetical protein
MRPYRRQSTLDLENEILAVRSKEQVARFVRWTGKETKRFGKLMEFFLSGDEPLAKKSAWIIGHCAEQHPELVTPWLKPMIEKIQEPGVHDALKRNAVRILQFADIPRRLQGKVANLCFELLSSIDESIGVRTFSITVLDRIAQKEPALKKELELIVRQMLPYATAAFRSRAKKVLKNPKLEDSSVNPEIEWLNTRESL